MNAARLKRILRDRERRARRKKDPVLLSIDRAENLIRKNRYLEKIKGAEIDEQRLARERQSSSLRRKFMPQIDPERYKQDVLRGTARKLKSREAKKRKDLENRRDSANVSVPRSAPVASSAGPSSRDVPNLFSSSLSAQDRAKVHRAAQHLLED